MVWKRKVALSLALLCLCVGAVSHAQEGAYGQINQDLAAPEGWRRIVQDSAFPLGERQEAGEIDGKKIYEVAFGAYPSIDGSTVSVPMTLEFARQHLSLSEEDLQGFVFLTTTHSAYVNLIEKRPNAALTLPSQTALMDARHPVDIIIATEPSDEELALAEANGVTLVKKPVCYDAFVFITHADNPVESLSVDQIRAIYAGEITSWKELGGKDIEIIPYQRGKNSGSQTAMENLVMRGEPITAALDNYIVGEMEGLVRRVGDYENGDASIGYTYLYYLDALYHDDNVKVLAIDGVSPTPDTMRSGAYPFSTSYYGVIRAGEEQQAGGLFLDWMLSPEGQQCIAQAGYVPMMALEE